MNTVATVHDKSKNELLDILEDKKQKQKKDNQKKYGKNKTKRHDDYVKKKKLIDCDCGKKVLNTSLNKHKLSKQHIHDVKEKARKQEVMIINIGPAADKVEELDPNYTEVSPSS
jgi:hypothetical protein